MVAVGLQQQVVGGVVQGQEQAKCRFSINYFNNRISNFQKNILNTVKSHLVDPLVNYLGIFIRSPK